MPILELPLPDPPPGGWHWIEAYRRLARGHQLAMVCLSLIWLAHCLSLPLLRLSGEPNSQRSLDHGRSLDPQLLHPELQRAAVDAEALRGAAQSPENPVGLLQRRENVRALGFFERPL
jgi:hypothetical protein